MGENCDVRKDVVLFAQTIVTKYQTRWHKKQQAMITMLSGLVSPKASLLSLKMTTFPCVLAWPFLCVHTSGVS